MIEISIPVELTEKTDNILIGYSLGSADLPHDRKMHVVGAGRDIRFSIDGIDGYVQIDLTPVAKAAAILLTGERVDAS